MAYIYILLGQFAQYYILSTFYRINKPRFRSYTILFLSQCGKLLRQTLRRFSLNKNVYTRTIYSLSTLSNITLQLLYSINAFYKLILVVKPRTWISMNENIVCFVDNWIFPSLIIEGQRSNILYLCLINAISNFVGSMFCLEWDIKFFSAFLSNS